MLLTLGSAHGNHENLNVAMEESVDLINGMNNISILSATVGLPVIVSIVVLFFTHHQQAKKISARHALCRIIQIYILDKHSNQKLIMDYMKCVFVHEELGSISRAQSCWFA